MALTQQTALGLDIGEKRIGVARAYLDVGFASPLVTLEQSPDILERLANLCAAEGAAWVVAGLPRGLEGQDTAQTAYARDFGARLEQLLDIPLYWTDEALTSVKAEHELQQRGKPYAKGDIDALAATYILEDYLQQEATHGTV